MLLLVDPSTSTVTSQLSTAPLAVNQFYHLHGHSDYEYVIRSLTRDHVMVHITTKPQPGQSRKSRRIVQRGTIQLLSTTAGSDRARREVSHVYQVELHPEKAIWPLGDLIEQLLAAGVHRHAITPMNQNGVLRDCDAAYNNPHMRTDGATTKTEVPGHGLEAGVDFTVKDATWAIRYHSDAYDTTIGSIYLWRDAAKHADLVLDVVRELLANE